MKSPYKCLGLSLAVIALTWSCSQSKKPDSLDIRTNTWIQINYPDAWQSNSDFLKLNDDHSTETMVFDQAVDFGASWEFTGDTLWLNRERKVENIPCKVHRAYLVGNHPDNDTLLLVNALFEKQICQKVFGGTDTTLMDFEQHDQHIQWWWYVSE